jgi:hypothetical protein
MNMIHKEVLGDKVVERIAILAFRFCFDHSFKCCKVTALKD